MTSIKESRFNSNDNRASNNRSYNNKNFGNNKFQKRNTEKFVPNFKKKVPTWKQIDAELKSLVERYDSIEPSKIESFEDFPLSKRTQQGLKSSNYINPTEIQCESIGIALKGFDLLGAAKTGSGKTLAFLIPILETLYAAKWSKLDGLGVLVISPTRELAYQTFEVLKKIGSYHDFSAGLVIGGKDLKTESKLITQTNIIICTPGRLLQHMDETWNFNCDNLKILVLDEADRILDLGFAETMNSIISNLPATRQTMLFSATQTKSIKDLARLSLKNPTFVSVHEHSTISTPKNLIQNYVICSTHEKISFLWSFIRNHLNQKIIVFFQSCKQVKFVYESFTKLQTGMTTLALYGTMNQIRRMEVYDQFCRKGHAILFATDIAARGLDFPSINWVIQMDCPADANTYIHRVGRTARYEDDGQAILVLTPEEEPEILNELKSKKIPITKLEVNMKRISNIDLKMQSLCAGDQELKESAKRALMAYLRSIFLMSNKKIFNIQNIDVVKFSSSLGLVTAPRIRFLQKNQNKKTKTEGTTKLDSAIKRNQGSSDDDEEDNQRDEPLNFSEITGQTTNKDDDDDDDDLFTVKQVFKFKPNMNGHDVESGEQSDKELQMPIKGAGKVKTKASVVRHLNKKNLKINEKIKFDDEGKPILTGINVLKSVNMMDKLAEEITNKDKDKNEPSGINIEEARERLRNEDQYDKQLYREKVKQMHKEKRMKEKELRRAKRAKPDDGAVGGAVLKTDDKDYGAIYQDDESDED